MKPVAVHCARCDSPPGTTEGCGSCEAYTAQERACYGYHIYPFGNPPPGFMEWLDARERAGGR